MHEELRTNDPWLATYLSYMGIELLRMEQRPDVPWKSTWVFADDDKRAWSLTMSFRGPDSDVVVPLRTFRDEYRRVLDAARNPHGPAVDLSEARYHRHDSSK